MTFLTMTRRALLRGGVAATALVISGRAWAQETPVRGGVIVAASDVQPRSLDAVLGNAPTSDRYTTAHIYDALIRLNADGSLSPSLAESWETVDDGGAFVLKLRPGVTFHDGTPFNADAVKFNLERTANPDTGSPQKGDLNGMASVEVVDDLTVRINMEAVNMGFLAALTTAAGMMSSPTVIGSMSVEDYGLMPVGTGPYKFKEWVIGSHVDLVRNDSYWRQGADGQPLPYSDGLRIRYVTNPAVKLIEVKAGSIHVAENIPAAEFPAIEADPNLQMLTAPQGILQIMAFNTTRAPMDDARVRRAISLAVDRGFMLDLISEGYGRVANGPAPPSGWDYNPDKPAPIERDVEGAKKLLDEAGHGGGLKLSMLIVQRDPDTLIAQIIQQQLADIGIEVEINAPDRSAITAIRTGGEWDIFLTRYNPPRPDPVQIYDLYFGRNAAQNYSNITGDEPLFAAIDAARTALTVEERKAHYLAAQERLIEQSYFAFLFFREARHVAQASLRNLTVDGGGVWNIAETWLS